MVSCTVFGLLWLLILWLLTISHNATILMNFYFFSGITSYQIASNDCSDKELLGKIYHEPVMEFFAGKLPILRKLPFVPHAESEWSTCSNFIIGRWNWNGVSKSTECLFVVCDMRVDCGTEERWSSLTCMPTWTKLTKIIRTILIKRQPTSVVMKTIKWNVRDKRWK